jgi:hypothetical protein
MTRINPRRPLTVTSLGRVQKRLADASQPAWCGALSFEDRCVTSFDTLVAAGGKFAKIHLLNYSTDVKPSNEAQVLREANRSRFQTLASRAGLKSPGVIDVEAYSFNSVQLAVASILEQSDFVVWDLSCLTKIHALAMACTLASTAAGKRWALAYTVPETYNLRDTTHSDDGGWSDIIVAPLAETAELFNEADGRGIVIPGHEGDRLIVGLAEIEPSGGTIVFVESAGRPDLRALTERRNQRTVTQLVSLRASNWRRMTLPLTGLEAMTIAVSEEVSRAKKKAAPVILFPYGPKPLIAVAAFELIRTYARSSWFVYPVPSRYDSGYTQGASATFWIGRQRPELA